MIIQQLKLENFGVYKGKQVFDLRPQPLNGYNRPIVLLRGKNGAGKTTIIEAIRLCLHGSLALGPRVSRSSYEEYLKKHVHISQQSSPPLNSARITLFLEYVSEGKRRGYKIERAWDIDRDKVKETIQVWEDNVLLPELETREEIESYLRELVLPGVADLFFFDGEKLHTLEESQTVSDTLANSVKALLGLHLVEQLQKDLDIYLARQKSNRDDAALREDLAHVTRQISTLEKKRSMLAQRQHENAEAMTKKQSAIAEQKQRIASQGRWFAERLENLQATYQNVELEIESLRRQAQDLASGLLPFAIAPQITASVAQRLKLEAEYETAVAAQKVLDTQLTHLAEAFESPVFWLRIGSPLDENVQQNMLQEVKTILAGSIQSPTLEAQDVIHRVSAQDRQTLLSWIEASRTTVPQEFCQIIGRLNALEEKLAQVKSEIALVPDDKLLSPLVETLQALNREFGVLLKTETDLAEELHSLNYELEQTERQRELLRQQIADQNAHDERVKLASKTQVVLKTYAQDLSQEKTALLAKRLTQRFNALCRKEDLVSRTSIDTETFEITLYRQEQPFAFKQLSAGESQLLAMALMWALREVSGVPMPVVIDTPLGRLDSDHRLKLVQEYFPRVSHQVILLATDTEVDDRLVASLAPAISHTYYLDYDMEKERTLVHESWPIDILVPESVMIQ